MRFKPFGRSIAELFFSFHYVEDVDRAMVVRNSWVIEGAPSRSSVHRQSLLRGCARPHQGDLALKRSDRPSDERDDSNGDYLSKTLIHSNRKRFKYEIDVESIERGNGLLQILTSARSTEAAKLQDLTTRCGYMFRARRVCRIRLLDLVDAYENLDRVDRERQPNGDSVR